MVEKSLKTLIVIPTYNERGNIEELIERILSTVAETDLLIIDDNSPDGTGQLVDEIQARRPQVSVLHREGKLGLGTAYIRGFQYALEHSYDLVFEMDADFSHDPKYLPDFLRAAQGPPGADLVIGSRYIPGGDTPNWKPLRRFISGGGNIFARAVLGIPVHDCTSGFRCYRTAALATLHLDRSHSTGYAFQVELAYAMWRSGYRVREIPIVFYDRRVGQSKMSRRIFIEGFTWVLKTRVNGSPVVSRLRHGAAPTRSAPTSDEPESKPHRQATTGRP
jgi:dolichol-phosphate mannosyltransferase